jgi:hypothetical protein
MLRLDWLENHMQHSDTLALWLHQQFHYEFPDLPLPDWQKAFSEGQHNGQWRCLIASTATSCWAAPRWPDDLPERPNSALGWPACSSPRRRVARAWPSG